MLSLSPAKLLVILIIALIVLGPEKLPHVARQMGAAWHDLRRLRSRLENEVRNTFPDLPPAHEVAQVVRSPLAFLDRLADEHERAQQEAEAAQAPSGETTSPPGAGPPGTGPPATAHDLNGASANGASAVGAELNGAELNGAGLNGASANAADTDGARRPRWATDASRGAAPTAPWGSGAGAAGAHAVDDASMN